MKSQKELREDLERAYTAACEQAGIESWNKFAEFIGIPYPSIYRIIANKGNATESMLRRIYTELALKGIKINNNPITIASNNAQNISAPVTQTTTDERWFDLVAEKDKQIAEKDKQIDRLLGIIENSRQ